MLFINKLFNSIACLLHFINLQLVIPGRTWILLYLGRTVYKRLWACLALYQVVGGGEESATFLEHAGHGPPYVGSQQQGQTYSSIRGILPVQSGPAGPDQIVERPGGSGDCH